MSSFSDENGRICIENDLQKNFTLQITPNTKLNILIHGTAIVKKKLEMIVFEMVVLSNPSQYIQSSFIFKHFKLLSFLSVSCKKRSIADQFLEGLMLEFQLFFKN